MIICRNFGIVMKNFKILLLSLLVFIFNACGTSDISSKIVEKKKLLVPLYSYPVNSNDSWDKLIELKQKYKSVEIVAIVNQSNGDFTDIDNNYVNGIEDLNKSGIIPIGYVYTKYGKRDIEDVKKNIDNWIKFYKPYGLKGFFIDEVSSKKEDFSYYKEISDYIKSYGLNFIVLNPGAVVDDVYIKNDIASVIVTRETTYKDLLNDDKSYYNKPTDKTKLGLIVYGATGENIVDNFYNFAKKYKFDYLYLTEHGINDDRYEKLSSYLDELLLTFS